MEDLGELAPLVQILDLPVPQMVENDTDTLLRILDFPIAEQVIEVPKISCSPCPSRSRVPEPQLAEHLVEVPTVLTPTRIAVQIAEQIVGIPVPHGRVQGLLPGQSSTAVSAAKRISEWTVEQNVDISSGVGLGQGSSSSARPAEEDFTGFFRTFPHGKKVRSAGQVSADLPRHVSSWTPAAYEQSKGSHEKEKEKEKEKEEAEYERRMQVLNQRVVDGYQSARLTTRLGVFGRALLFRRLQPGRGGRGKRGGRDDFLALRVLSFLAALVVDNDSGMLAMLVLLDMMHLVLCSLLASPGPRCSASWPVWTRRTVAVAFTWLVLLVTMHLALCSLLWFAGLSWTPWSRQCRILWSSHRCSSWTSCDHAR